MVVFHGYVTNQQMVHRAAFAHSPRSSVFDISRPQCSMPARFAPISPGAGRSYDIVIDAL